MRCWPYTDCGDFAPRHNPYPVPTTGVSDDPATCIRLNNKWRSFVLGCLNVLMGGQYWSDSLNTPDAVEHLKELFSTGSGDCCWSYKNDFAADLDGWSILYGVQDSEGIGYQDLQRGGLWRREARVSYTFDQPTEVLAALVTTEIQGGSNAISFIVDAANNVLFTCQPLPDGKRAYGYDAQPVPTLLDGLDIGGYSSVASTQAGLVGDFHINRVAVFGRGYNPFT